MERRRYSKEFVGSVLKDFKETGDVGAVAEKYSVSRATVYRFRREARYAPEISKDKRIKVLGKELKRKSQEVELLRELLKKTYQAMPISAKSPKNI